MTNHRLLYRGALELPDSYMVLDGLSFTLAFDSTPSVPGERGDPAVTSTPSGKSELDPPENPLALALESMRGRPTLQFLGTTKIADVHVDGSFNANVSHPTTSLSPPPPMAVILQNRQAEDPDADSTEIHPPTF